MSERHTSRSADWERLHHGLVRALYEADPEGMGSSVYSPDDEYSSEAVALIRALRDRRAKTVRAVVLEAWPNARSDLIDAIVGLSSAYEAGPRKG